MGTNENIKDELVGETTAKVDDSMEAKPIPNENTVKLKQLMRQLSDSPAIMTGNSSSLAKRYTTILSVVALYWFVSITLVFLNKSLLSGGTSVDAPLFITCFQCTVTAAACYAIVSLPPNFWEAKNLSCGQITISIQTLKKVLPLSVVFVAMITFNNLCLKYVGVSFYYVGRSLTTVFNVAFTYLILGQKTSVRAILCCFIILLGFWLGVDQESNAGSLSLSGTIYGVLASVFVSLYAIYIKRILPVVDGNVWLLTFYNNVNAMLLFIPMMIIFGEFPVILAFDGLFSPTFWFLMTLGGVFGCGIGYVTGLQVKVTSPLTHNISGTAKAAAQTVLATHVNAEIKSFWWWVSNAVVLIGSAMYARVRQLEMKSETKREILPSSNASTSSAEIEKKESKP